MAKDNKPIINRTAYKAIKKYDHQQMENFARNLYEQGVADGAKITAGKIVDMDAVMQAIGNTKGIGPAKMQELSKSISALFNKGLKKYE